MMERRIPETSRPYWRCWFLVTLWIRHPIGVCSYGDISVGSRPYALERELDDDRVSFVKDTLNSRVKSVQSGERKKLFHKWAMKQQGDLQIFSMHGASETAVDLSKNDTIKSVPNKNSKAKLYSGKTTFSANILDLDLVPNPKIPSRYAGKPLSVMDERPPNVLELFGRSIHLTFNFFPVLSTVGLAVLWRSFRENVWYKWVSNCLAASGPAFIKWGQWAATRSDMFPEALCRELADLHSAAPSHSWKYTQRQMESSLGLPPGRLLEVFGSFDPQPIASGSIAQVHTAVLSGSSTRLAVKVRHPNVARLIDTDFRLMQTAAALADMIPALSWLHVRDTVEQFSHTMAAQAYLNVEGYHLEVLNHNFRSWKQVRYPVPFYASTSVIIESFESGRIISGILDDYDAVAAQKAEGQESPQVEEVVDDDDNDDDGTKEGKEGSSGYQLIPTPLAKFIVTTGLSIYLKMLLVDNLMHADLHPGNIMLDLVDQVAQKTPGSDSKEVILPTDSSTIQQRLLALTLVDAGMVAQLTPEESTNFIGLLCSLGSGDGKVAARFALRFSQETALNEEQQEEFIHDMDVLFQERCRGYGTPVDVGHVLRGVLGLIRKHQVRVDANYATLIVNCLCIEGLAGRTCPDYGLLDAAKPLLQSFEKLCYDADGIPIDNPSNLQKTMVRLSMASAYRKKTGFDNKFFSQRQKRIKKVQKKGKVKEPKPIYTDVTGDGTWSTEQL